MTQFNLLPLIADHIIIGRPGFNVRDECKPKGIKM